MNFPTHRVEPAQLTSSEPTDFGGFVNSPSVEDEEADAREVWIVCGVVAGVLAAAFFAGGLWAGHLLWAVP